MFEKAIHHAVIFVSDLNKSLHFYKDILGWKIFLETELSVKNADKVLGINGIEGRAVILQIDVDLFEGMVELVHITNPKSIDLAEPKHLNSIGLKMISFRVIDIDQVYNNLIEKGVQFISPPKKLVLGDYSLKACIFRDPDNVHIEVIEFLS